ncbi:hypothetical protein GKZ68_17490 [Hymenobacter sp. BRD128]|uniref:hypothetical protein n=1 Tax=Hymenobacter sp. BRD128 TaxID=2675878 RepID=UPI001562EE32|nr:hypothetical protein [Hymenobacter sp. BRD128]QKG58259.1 hypothetical protein GKZ68_17490 [Hymenobacter sp. BRD128]
MLLALFLDENAILKLTGFVILGPFVIVGLVIIYALTKKGTSRSSRVCGVVAALLFAGLGSMVPIDGLFVLLAFVVMYALYMALSNDETAA